MSSSAETTYLGLKPPAYYAPDDRISTKNSLAARCFYAALPFLALHKPFGRIITLSVDSLKTVSSFQQLADKKNSKELLKTAIAVSALGGTIFMHPVGLCISTLYDLGCDLTAIIAKFQTGPERRGFLRYAFSFSTSALSWNYGSWLFRNHCPFYAVEYGS